MRSILVSFFFAFALVSLAFAQVEGPRVGRDDDLLLARICAHEAGFDADETGDCAAIHEVLYRGAVRQGLSYSAFAHSYSGRALRGETRRSYYAELDRDGRRPARWPAGSWASVEGTMRFVPGPSWSRYSAAWLELLAHAAFLVARHPDDVSPCECPVDDWGGAVDRARAERLGLVEVDCGETRNDFYQRPSLHPHLVDPD